jgi:hypothetical protein
VVDESTVATVDEAAAEEAQPILGNSSEEEEKLVAEEEKLVPEPRTPVATNDAPVHAKTALQWMPWIAELDNVNTIFEGNMAVFDPPPLHRSPRPEVPQAETPPPTARAAVDGSPGKVRQSPPRAVVGLVPPRWVKMLSFYVGRFTDRFSLMWPAIPHPPQDSQFGAF